MKNLDLLACPQCGEPLRADDSSVNCAGCGKSYPVRKGIICFSNEENPYAFVNKGIEQEEITRLTDIAEQHGWGQALEFAKQKNPAESAEFEFSVSNASRGAWKIFTDMQEDAVAVDIGCGWGALALSLAQNFKLVVAMDLTWERILMAQLRARDLGADNVLCFYGGDAPKLPFASQSLGLVVLNGVLEWIPEGRAGRPRDVQRAFLQEVHRVLRPDGQIYIGIENRAGYPYFLGRPEDHSRLKYVSLMPRKFANWYSNAKRGAPYRTYTYTMKGYGKLLRESGYPSTKAYCPFPDYRKFDRLIDLADGEQLGRSIHPQSAKGKLGLAALRRTGCFPHICPSYGLVASKKENPERFLDVLLDHIGHALGDPTRRTPANIHCRRILATQTETVLVFADINRAGKQSIAVRLPMSQKAETRTRKLAITLKTIQEMPNAKNFSHLLPCFLIEGVVRRQYFCAQESLVGASGEEMASNTIAVERMMTQAVDSLGLIHSNTASGCASLNTVLESLFKKFRQAALKHESNGSVVQSLDALQNRLSTAASAKLPMVLSHGDFALPNIIYSKRTLEIQGIIDWDQADAMGLPLMDLLHLLLKFDGWQLQKKSLEAFSHLVSQLGKETIEQNLLKRYLKLMPLDKEVVQALLMVYPLYHEMTFYEAPKSTGERLMKEFHSYFDSLAEVQTLVASVLGTIELNQNLPQLSDPPTLSR